MAVQLLGDDNSTRAVIEAGHKAMAIVQKPNKANGWFRIGAISTATSTLAAASHIFQLRNASASNLILVRNVSISAVATTGFTAAQLFDVGLAIARAWTVDGSAGQAFAFTGSQNLLRTSMQAPAALTARLCSGAALTPGTLTTDTNDLAVLEAWAVAATAGVLFNMQPIFNFDDGGGYPIVLAQNEGIILRPKTAWGAGGAVRFAVRVEFFEVPATEFLA